MQKTSPRSLLHGPRSYGTALVQRILHYVSAVVGGVSVPVGCGDIEAIQVKAIALHRLAVLAKRVVQACGDKGVGSEALQS